MNGFPNTYWDDGGEDDDIAQRYNNGMEPLTNARLNTNIISSISCFGK